MEVKPAGSPRDPQGRRGGEREGEGGSVGKVIRLLSVCVCVHI